jgi:hypothetical protein
VYADAALGNLKIPRHVLALRRQSHHYQKKETVFRERAIIHSFGVNKNVAAFDLIPSSSHHLLLLLILAINLYYFASLKMSYGASERSPKHENRPETMMVIAGNV